MEVARVRARFELARTKKDLVRDELIEAFEYTNPIAAPNRSQDSIPNRLVNYDNTAEDAAVTLSNMLTTNLVPTATRWMRITLSPAADPARLPVDAINKQLERSTDGFFNALIDSKFYLAISDAMGNLVRGGSGCVAITINEYGLNYYSVPVAELSYLDDGRGCVDTVFRTHKLAASTVVRDYPDCSDTLKQQAERKPDEMLEVREAMYRTEDAKSSKERYTFAVYIGEGWECVSEKTLPYRNLIVFRWDRAASLMWGESPIRRALPSIRIVNMLAKFYLTSGEFASQGCWVSSDESLRDQQFLPGAILYSTDPKSLQPVSFPGNFQLNTEMLTHYQTEIRAILFADAMPPASPSARYSAEELQQRQGMFFQKIGTVAHRLDEELLRPIIVQTIVALQHVGRMDPIRLGQKPVDIEHDDFVQVETNSLLMRVNNSQKAQQIVQGVQMAAQVAGMQAVSALLDMNGLARKLLELADIPASLVRSEQAVQQAQAITDGFNVANAAQATASGQGGNPEVAQSAGQSAANLMQTAQKNPQAAATIMQALPRMGGIMPGMTPPPQGAQ